MGGKRRYYLSQSTTNEGRKSPKGLHIAIWEHHSGQTIPAGFEVHHRDGDTFNFERENLECLPAATHRSLPKNIDREKVRANLANIRPKANAWHSSAAGREWHRSHVYESIHKPGALPYIRNVIGSGKCRWCGDEFQKKSKRRVFCGPKCQVQESGFRRGKYTFVHPNYACVQS
ncbi:HNH endonuclease signature motif containing protein [Rhizobium lusitanum]|uniref:HNH endonuclease signature motif containing protein n=1 Tax=Rhizobium lusitanum TaxID=293958 RepID=UPI003CC9559D